MKILRKYILFEFFKIFIPVSIFLILIFALSEFFWRLPDFISHKTPYSFILYYLYLHLPLWFVQSLPITLMLTTLLLITHLQYTMELVSIKILGINTRSFFVILIALGVLFSVLSFIIYEKVATKWFNNAQIFFNTTIKKIPPINNVVKNLFYYDRINDTFIYIDEYDSNNKTIKNWFAEKFKEGFLEEIIFSPFANKETQVVILKDCVIYKYKKNNFLFQTKIALYKYPLAVDIENFQFDYNNMQLDQKNIKEIKKIIEFVKYKGDNPSKFFTEIYFRYAISILNFIVILLAIPIAQITPAKHGSLISFIYTIIFLISYWVILAVFRSICEIGILHPLYVFVANFLFLIIGVFFYFNVS